MNAYDFDDTIFQGDSTARFIAFCARHYPRVWLHAPAMALAGARFLMGKMEKTAFKQRMYGFLRYVPDIECAVANFWQEKERFLQNWYQKKRRADDVIISASPEFLLAPVAKKLGVRLIASRVDARTGQYDGVNCHGEEKVRRFRAEFGDAPVEEFYSDSLSDMPMARISEKAFLVKGETITPWPFQ